MQPFTAVIAQLQYKRHIGLPPLVNIGQSRKQGVVSNRYSYRSVLLIVFAVCTWYMDRKTRIRLVEKKLNRSQYTRQIKLLLD